MKMRPMQLRLPSRQRGIMLLDVTVGLIIIGIVATLLATAISRQSLASQRLAEQRDATRLAEDALSRLQANQPLPNTTGQVIEVRYLPDETPVNGNSWVEVKATIGRRSATLTGLVPVQGEAVTQ